jgi:mRNA interferase MazF
MILQIPFELPSHWSKEAWVKGDMIQTVAWHRMDLLRIGKDRTGRRVYQIETLPAEDLRTIQACVLEGLSLSRLTEYL